MMTPRITPEQRQAIDERQGQPVYLVDTEQNETFVLQTTSSYRGPLPPQLDSPSADTDWSDTKNERRLALIDRKVAGQITDTELVELAILQRQAEQHFDQIAPPPMRGVRELHQQLLKRRANQ